MSNARNTNNRTSSSSISSRCLLNLAVRLLARISVFCIAFSQVHQAIWLSFYYSEEGDAATALQESSSSSLLTSHQQHRLKEQFLGGSIVNKNDFRKKQHGAPAHHFLTNKDQPQTAVTRRKHDGVTTTANLDQQHPPRIKKEGGLHNNDSPFHFVICTRMRNEGPYIREWIEYHRMIGVEAFMIMNDNSTDETQCILDEYIQQGIVYPVTSERGEAFVFDVCVDQMKRTLKWSKDEMATTWIATHDVDEFIWLDTNITASNKTHNNTSLSSPLELVVRSLLERYTSMQSIVIPRFLFGTSGHDHYQPDPVIGRFTQRFDVNQCPHQQESQRQRRLSMAFGGGVGDGDTFLSGSAQERRPISMCSPLANVATSYPGDGKSLSRVPALARNCWKPVLEEIRRKNTTRWTLKRNRCHTTHFHLLRNRSALESDSLVFTEQERGKVDRIMRSNSGGSSSSKTGGTIEHHHQQQQQPDYYDDRYVGYAQVVDSIAIMHYMTRSKEEFFQRTCASDFLKKYHQCSNCTPETYLELAESYSNNLRDERMMPLVKPLQERLMLLQNSSRSSGTNSQCHVEPLRTTEPWEYYRECWRTKKIAHEKAQHEMTKFGKRKRRRPRSPAG